MFAKGTLVALGALVGATVSTAQNVHAVRSLISRQLSTSDIPSACQSECTQTVTIYNACVNDDTTGCLAVCEQDTFNAFVNCFTCVLEDSSGVDANSYQSIADSVAELQQACTAAGATLTPTSLVPFQSLSQTATDIATDTTGAIASVTSDDGFSFTSAASGGVTIGAGAPSTGAPSGAVASTTPVTSVPLASSAPASSAATTDAAPSVRDIHSCIGTLLITHS
ncbi:hypothetical protein BCR39DRAFT_525059 [Naematelia encephala]|uniref:Extracellular membrane protein CFEM domain-containing protein n=1 Tax=Naematelia encephala TaxID=71784 RepID=A0A1Y2BD58_9TREE|nr:hypothetical protein BCR39DRAFT_525059 [Naematelia encephala]